MIRPVLFLVLLIALVSVTAPARSATDPHHYARFSDRPLETYTGRMLNERLTVKEYDQLRAGPSHPLRLEMVRADLGLLAYRLYGLAHGLPHAWALFHRGWRFQQLELRVQGQLVP